MIVGEYLHVQKKANLFYEYANWKKKNRSYMKKYHK